MGIDVKLLIECDGPAPDFKIYPDDRWEDARDWEKNCGANYSLWTGARYYGPGYERGPWPEICAVLMQLFADSRVKRIWYFGDCSNMEDIPPLMRVDVLEISGHFMSVGHEPYRRLFR